jgi:tetratricopeptide (TPR) repeat protein
MRDESERDERLMTLVEAALDQPSDTQDDFVRGACGSDPDLCAEVLQRVRWEQQMSSFLRESVLSVLEFDDCPFENGELVAGRFRILGEVGRGGMGVVYEALDEKLNRRVAIKCAQRGYGNHLPPETRAAREVSHFNVCKVHDLHSVSRDLGEVEFMTMEFIEGETLSARIRRSGRLLPGEAREIAVQICAGLAQAHRQGVIHGDLKCGNIILAAAEGRTRAVITDFGLATMKLREANENTPEQGGGSFDYMAPELFSGAAASVLSDLYGLGVIFHVMLTGKVPSPANRADLGEKGSTLTLGKAVPRRFLTRRCERLPTPWGRVVPRCLETAPEDRFRSAEEVVEWLEAPGKGRYKWLSAGLAAAAILAFTLQPGREQLSPPVRLAVLPVVTEGTSLSTAAGLGLELADRLSGARRGFVVIPPHEAERYQVDTLPKAKAVLAATHVLRTRLRNSGSQFTVEASVIEIGSGVTLQELRADYPSKDLSLLAKALTATITRAFQLRTRVPLEVLATAAYPSYVQGLNFLRRDESSADEAIPFLLKASELDQRSALPYAAIAEAYLQKFWRGFGAEWMDRATQAVSKAQSLNPDSAPVLLAAGYMKQLHGWYDQAVRDYARAEELAPGNADAWNRLALAYSAMNQPDRAIATYRKALQAQPDYYAPYIEFGRFYRRRLQYAEAEQLFRHVTALAPGLALGHMLLGLVLEQEDRLQEAEQALLASLRLQETTPALTDLGALYYQQERYGEAEHYFERSLQLGPAAAVGYLNLGDAYRHLGRATEATSIYRRAEDLARAEVSQNPSDAFTRSLYAYILAYVGDRDTANFEMAEALVMSGGDGRVTRNAALVFEALGERDKTFKVLADAPAPLIEELSRQPDVKNLQHDPQFQELLRSKAAQR